MVLSGSKKTSSISSITNQKTFGGDKKSGLQYSVGRSAWSTTSFHCRGLPKSLPTMYAIKPRNPSMNLPIGFRSQINMH